MLKFFRTIRKKLIEEDNVRKYLLYAIGEILLVVIGILIALQVNNWNEELKNRRSERAYLERLSRDIDLDAVALKDAIENAESWAQAAGFVLTALEDSSTAAFAPCRFARSMTLAQYSNWPVLNRQTYQELVSTGGLSLISDAELKAKLGQFYAEFDANGQFTDQFRQIALKYSDAIRGVWTIENRRELNASIDDTCKLTPEDALAARKRILARIGTIDWLPTLEARQNGFANRLTQSLNSAKDLTDHLHQAIGSK